MNPKQIEYWTESSDWLRKLREKLDFNDGASKSIMPVSLTGEECFLLESLVNDLITKRALEFARTCE